MSYFSFKNRTFVQMALIGLGSYGLYSTFSLVLQSEFDSWGLVISLLLSLGCIWSGTSPNKKKETSNSNEDILDAP